MKLEPTIEEGLDLPPTAFMGTDESATYDGMGDIYTNLSPSSSNATQLNRFSDMLIAPDSQVESNGDGLHHATLQHTNSTPSFSGARPSSEIGDNNLVQPYVQTIGEQGNHHTNNQNIVVTSEQPMSSSGIVNTATPATQKAKSSSRKNAWGSQSYADLITEAIESSPEKRLTLAQIYEYMVKNIDYFSDKGESNSSAGWKNSIRHNLSLHDKFKRIQNEGTGKSSWWTINYNAKPGKPTRRRVQSMDQGMAKADKHRAQKAVKRKNEKSK
jgi:hypothetical protein